MVCLAQNHAKGTRVRRRVCSEHTRHLVLSMTDFTTNATPSQSNTIRKLNSNSLLQIQIKPKSQFEFIPRDTKKSEFLDLVGFGDEAFSVETVIHSKPNQTNLVQEVEDHGDVGWLRLVGPLKF